MQRSGRTMFAGGLLPVRVLGAALIVGALVCSAGFEVTVGAGAAQSPITSDPAAVAADASSSPAAVGQEEARLDAARHHAHLKFAPCPENASVECGTLTVPVDYLRPYGDTVGIAVIRAPALDPAQRIGILVGNPGGPGISGVDFVLGGVQSPAFSLLRQRFDIVSFDPRGVKRSRQVRCSFDQPDRPAQEDAAVSEYFDELGRRFARACLEQNGPFVAHIGTSNAARDIDMIRRAMGEAQITYAAGSYGSELGATYASMFPRRVRAMMLDGGIGPDFRDFNVEAWSIYSQGFEMAFQRFDQVCRRDSGCRLQSGATATLDELLARLDAAPVTSPGGAQLTSSRVRSILATLLGSERNWPLMANALADAASGNYALFFQMISVGSGSGNTALYPIWCNDYGTRRPAADYLRFDEANGALHPRFFGRFFVANAVALCSQWPAAEPPKIRNVARELEVPILIVGNDFDPNTPLIEARRLASALGMEKSLIRYEGSGHTAYFQGIACIDTAIDAYLVQRRLPPAGFSCPAVPVRFSPAAARATVNNGTGVVQIATGLWSAAPALVP